LYTFGGPDGELPYSGLVQGNDGNFYGTTHAGGSHNDGTVFSLTPATLIPTTTVLMSAPNPSTLGQAVTMTATVAAQDHSLPTGTVKFQSNGVDIGSASLNGSGVAVLIYAGLSAGTDSLTAIYQGSGDAGGQHLQHCTAGGESRQHHDVGDQLAQSFHVRGSGDHNRDGKSGGAAGADGHRELHLERHRDFRLHRSAAVVAHGRLYDFDAGGGDGCHRGDLLRRYELFR